MKQSVSPGGISSLEERESVNRTAEIILPPDTAGDLRDAAMEVDRRLRGLFAMARRKPGSPGVHLYVQVDGRECTTFKESIAHINELPLGERRRVIELLSKNLPG